MRSWQLTFNRRIKDSSPDLVHNFYNNQMQIHGGSNDQFAAFSMPVA